jgi:hypothetical protein
VNSGCARLLASTAGSGVTPAKAREKVWDDTPRAAACGHKPRTKSSKPASAGPAASAARAIAANAVASGLLSLARMAMVPLVPNQG